ncbi:amidase [Candidatus Adlerbacteria bacterium RIFCSPHIGHO2_02_FULL_54_18]|uniref:Amidase n=2 Tax=Candidatus Adleribacteriota TaxID=1752736 RepID=A0A1F4Y241_9BACT|nr:MAG: amidase [Candidatus Adlerbacteria bacterium RIFCSPLOWO2_01_FULL_54_21b]OGC88009.1 MAG: amidase [Candidatus Adlerbacteria bacterium RIFCSPHIGHO2_02_FULL_54_18]
MNRLFIDNSIGELISRVEQGELSVQEMVSAALHNIREGEQYGAFVVYAGDSLPKSFEGAAAKKGLLPYIPLGIKDIYNTTDFPTQMGSPLWKDFTPGNDARAVYNLKRQGALVVGKTVTAEFAVHELDKTLNPHDKTKTPGTSSSGSAVAVALGMVPAATGTQTAGSIVRPASFCGVYACKPSFGTIPRTGMLKTTDSLDSLGFFAVYAEDLRRMFNAMKVSGRNYPLSHAALSETARQQKPASRPWKVAFVRTHTWGGVPQYAKDAMDAFAKKLSAEPGFEVEETEIPASMSQTHETHATIYNKSLSYYFQHEYTKAEQISPIMRQLIEQGKDIDRAAFAAALERQNKMIRDMDAFFADYDAVICLSTSGEAPPRDVPELPDPALMWTLTHLPVISAPTFTSPAGLPFGLQLAARKYNDYLLFQLLEELQTRKLLPKQASYVQ